MQTQELSLAKVKEFAVHIYELLIVCWIMQKYIMIQVQKLWIINLQRVELKSYPAPSIRETLLKSRFVIRFFALDANIKIDLAIPIEAAPGNMVVDIRRAFA